jgi:hypothetical protein
MWLRMVCVYYGKKLVDNILLILLLLLIHVHSYAFLAMGLAKINVMMGTYINIMREYAC